MRKNQFCSSKNPSIILTALEKLDQTKYTPDCQGYFKGYVNSNHSCFVNSYFQAIFIINEVINSIKNTSDGANIIVKEIIDQMESTKAQNNIIRLNHFIKHWSGWINNSMLPLAENGYLIQQDVHEFHSCVVNSLGENTKEMFIIILEKKLTRGNIQTLSYDTLTSLIFHIDDGNILNSLNNYFTPEVTEDSNYLIENKINKCPQVLTINLNRIENGIKNTQQIEIPLSLNLSKYLTENCDGCPIYHLCSICYHIGISCDYGHWKTIKKVFNHWVICDNNKVDVLELNKYSQSDLLAIQEEIMRNASFLIYESHENQELNLGSFSLVESTVNILHQTEVLMDSNDASKFELKIHPPSQNPISIQKTFPSLIGNLYIAGGEIPETIIGRPPDPEWILITNFIKVGQRVFSKDKWKFSDQGMANRDATWSKLIGMDHYQSDNNIQIAMQSELIMNLYLNYLIHHKKIRKKLAF